MAQVLMYCTGGIRCEKASIMLKQRGVQDVFQLSGGIHRYLERYPDGGLFKGKNFVFDKRISLGPATAAVVGTCRYCTTPYDTLHGGRLCTVCREMVLVCPSCRATLKELHCDAHASLERCYFTFLDHYSAAELEVQRQGLELVIGRMGPGSSRKKRRTLVKQLARVESRLQALQPGEHGGSIAGAAAADAVKVEPWPKGGFCRTCYAPSTQCNG